MKTLALCITLAAAPAIAQDAPKGDMADGADLMRQGAQLLFRGLMNQFGGDIARMKALTDQVGDLWQYQFPEVLPNGDILIRKKPPTTPDQAPKGDVDL